MLKGLRISGGPTCFPPLATSGTYHLGSGWNDRHSPSGQMCRPRSGRRQTSGALTPRKVPREDLPVTPPEALPAGA